MLSSSGVIMKNEFGEVFDDIIKIRTIMYLPTCYSDSTQNKMESID